MHSELGRAAFQRLDILGGIAVAICLCFVWEIAIVQIWGYWAIERLNETSSQFMQFTAPTLVFWVTVGATLFLVMKLPQQLARAAIPFAAILFCLAQVIAAISMDERISGDKTGPVLVMIVVLSCIFFWGLVKRRNA